MEFTSVAKIFQAIRASDLSDNDKKFITDHTWEVIHETVADCGLIVIKTLGFDIAEKATTALVDARNELRDKEAMALAAMNKENVYHKNTVVLTDKSIHTNGDNDLKIYLESDNVDIIERFKWICKHNLPKEFRVFHKLNHRDIQRFDFWKPVVDDIIVIGKLIEVELGVKFLVDIDVDRFPIKNNERQTAIQWKSFDEDKHEFDDFDPVVV